MFIQIIFLLPRLNTLNFQSLALDNQAGKQNIMNLWYGDQYYSDSY